VEILDIAFDKNNRMWAVTLSGEVAVWNNLCWDRKNYSGFRKIRSIAFDKKGRMWALNYAKELALWDDGLEEWEPMELPPSVQPVAIAFDNRNNLWCVGSQKELAQLSGTRWINFGYLATWKLNDISFRWVEE